MSHSISLPYTRHGLSFSDRVGGRMSVVASASRAIPRGFVMRHAMAQLIMWSAFYYLLPAILPHMLAGTGWSSVVVSGAFTAVFLFWAVLSPVAGAIIDRGYGAVAMRLAGGLGALLLLIFSVVQSQTLALGILVVLGLPMAMTLYDPCFSLMITRFGAGQSSRRAITVVTLVAGLATLLTFPLVAWLASAGMDWRWIVRVFAVLVCIAVLIMPADGGARSVAPRPDGVLAHSGGKSRAVAIGMAFALVMLGHALLLFQLPLQLAKLTDGDAALMLPMVLGPAQIFGRLVWGALLGRMALDRAAIVLFGFMILPPLMLFMTSGLTVALIALIIQGAGFGVQTVIRPMLSAQWLPETGFAQQLGLIAMIGLLFMALAPVLGAWVATASGVTGLVAMVLAVDLAGLALLLGLVVTARKEAWV